MDRFFFRFVTVHEFDRQTDVRTPFSRLDRPALKAARYKMALFFDTTWLWAARISKRNLKSETESVSADDGLWWSFVHASQRTVRRFGPV